MTRIDIPQDTFQRLNWTWADAYMPVRASLVERLEQLDAQKELAILIELDSDVITTY